MTSSLDTSPRSTAGPFAALLLAVLSFSLLQTMVVPALPDLQRELGATPTASTWVISAFLLTSSVGTVVIGRLGDMFGKRRLLVVSLALLAAGTLLAALAGSIGLLVAGRAVQGLGAGTFPLAFGVVRDTFPRDRVPVAIGTISAVFGIGFGAGLVLPGPITDALGWPWLFWSSLVVILLALAAVLAFVAPDRGRRDRGRVDWAGALVLTVALVALLLATSQLRLWPAGTIVGLAAVAALALVGFGVLETRRATPLIDVRLLRRRPLVTANVTALIIGFAMYGAFTLMPQLVQTPPEAGYGFGASVTEAGLYLLPMAVTMLFAGPLAGRLGARVGFLPVLVTACLVGAVGFALFAVGHHHVAVIATGAGILGVGIGLAFSSLVNVVVDAVGPHETGEATEVNTIVRTVGGSLGAQVATAIVTATTVASTGLPTSRGYTTALWVSAAALVVAALVARAGAPRGGAGVARR